MFSLTSRGKHIASPDENLKKTVTTMLSQQIDQWIQEDWTFEVSALALHLVSPCKAFRIKFFPLGEDGYVLGDHVEMEGNTVTENGLITASWLHHALTRAIDIAKEERK
jgi:hypothetical protein